MSFRAMEETKLVLAPLSDLRSLLAIDLRFTRMVGELTEAAAQLGMQIACELLIKDAPRRVAATLLRVTAVREGARPNSELGFRISQFNISEMSALSRLHTNRILQQLQALDYIEISYGHIKIVSPEGLADFVLRGG